MGKRRARKMLVELMNDIGEQQSKVKDSSVANYLSFVSTSIHCSLLEMDRERYLTVNMDRKIREGI